MKTQWVVIKMAFGKFSQCSAKWQLKLKFFEMVLKTHPTKGENAFESFSNISFITWAVGKKPKFWVYVMSLARKGIKQRNFSGPFFANSVEKQKYVPQNTTSKHFEKNKNITGICHSEFIKNQRISALSQRCFRQNQCWNSVVQRFSDNEERWIRTETFLNQSWSALTVSKTSTRVPLFHLSFRHEVTVNPEKFWIRHLFPNLNGHRS